MANEQDNIPGTASSFPDESVNPDIKAKKPWLMQFSKAVYYAYVGLPIRSIGYRSAIRYRRLKTYAMGRQDVEHIKARVRRGDKKVDGNLKTDWSVLQVYPELRRIAVKRCLDAANGYELRIRAIDPTAQDEMAKEIATAKAKAGLREALVAQGAGEYTQSPELKPLPGEPEDTEGVELMSMGARHFTDAQMEDLVKKVMNANDYNLMCKTRDEDLIDYGVSGFRDDTDGTFITLRHVDPERLVLPYFHDSDQRDMRYAGELVDIQVSALLAMSDGQLSKAEIEQIYEIGKRFGTNVYAGGSNPTTLNEFWSRGTVRVLDLELLTTDTMSWETGVNRFGNLLWKKSDGEARGGNGSAKDREVIQRKIQNTYQVKWVVGTNICFDYGRQSNQKRDPLNRSRSMLSYHIATTEVYHMESVSRTEAIIPFADAIQTTWCRLQNALNSVVPKGYMIDVGALESIDLTAGGKAMSPQQIIDFFFETGILVVRSQGQVTPGAQQMPIIPTEGGVGSEIAEFWTLINNNIELMRKTLGLNEATDGSTINAKTLNGAQQAMEMSTNNALSDVIFAGRKMEASLGKSVVIRAQSIYRSDNREAFLAMYGMGAASAFGKIRNIDSYIYATDIEDLPTEAEEAQFAQDLNDAVASGQIGIDDCMMLRTIPNLYKRQAYLSYRVKKVAANKQQEALTLQQSNAQVSNQSTQATLDADLKRIQAKQQAEAANIQLEKDLDMRNDERNNIAMLQGKQIDGASRVESYAIQAEQKMDQAHVDNHAGIIKQGMQLGGIALKQQQDHATYQESQQPAATEPDAPPPQQPSPQPALPQAPTAQSQPDTSQFSFLNPQPGVVQQQPQMADAA